MAEISRYNLEHGPGYRPGASVEAVGQVRYAFTWDAAQVEQVIELGVGRMMDQLAADVEVWLRSNLHEYTGEMRSHAYGRNERVPTGFVVHGGSDTDHTFWHEVRYHPQLRQCMDLFAPTMGERLRDELGF